MQRLVAHQVPLPETRHRPILGLRRPLADVHHVPDLPLTARGTRPVDAWLFPAAAPASARSAAHRGPAGTTSDRSSRGTPASPDRRDELAHHNDPENEQPDTHPHRHSARSPEKSSNDDDPSAARYHAPNTPARYIGKSAPAPQQSMPEIRSHNTLPIGRRNPRTLSGCRYDGLTPRSNFSPFYVGGQRRDGNVLRGAVESSLPAKGTLYPSGDFYASDVLIPSVDISRRRP